MTRHDLVALTCIRCVRHVDPVSDDAEGWVLVRNSVDDGDEHDDSQWVCPDCSTGSEDVFNDPDRQVRDTLEDAGGDP